MGQQFYRFISSPVSRPRVMVQVPTPADQPTGTVRIAVSPAGGFEVSIHLRHSGEAPLVDLFQVVQEDHAPNLLHPHDGPTPFRACPGMAAPGWTSVGVGILPGEEAGPFVAWCAHPGTTLSFRWRAENPLIGGTFEIEIPSNRATLA